MEDVGCERDAAEGAEEGVEGCEEGAEWLLLLRGGAVAQ